MVAAERAFLKRQRALVERFAFLEFLLQDMNIGETGIIQADAISGKDMMIAGEVNGNVKCGGRLRLTSTARLTGNIRARTLVLDDGAMFNGMCNMTKPASPRGDSKETKKV